MISWRGSLGCCGGDRVPFAPASFQSGLRGGTNRSDEIPAPEQVAISGIINDAAGPIFRLRYGAGEISVALEGWERFREAGAPPVMGVGDRVTVTGAADEAFYSAQAGRADTLCG